MSLSNYQYNQFHAKTFIYIQQPLKIYPKISEKAIKYLKKNKISVVTKDGFSIADRFEIDEEGGYIKLYNNGKLTDTKFLNAIIDVICLE